MHDRKTWFLALSRGSEILALGECAMLKGLSYDDRPEFEAFLNSLRLNPEALLEKTLSFPEWPSIQTGVEMLRAGAENSSLFKLFPGPFERGERTIPINGLIWMGSEAEMKHRIREKLNLGWNCLKLKIGSLDFTSECAIIREIRREYGNSDLILRLDANGAFSPDNALEKLSILSHFDIHSIEQPIPSGQWEAMAAICENSPIPVALDEELIGINERSRKIELLEIIRPAYLVLKPTLHGGFSACDEWLELAEKMETGWWVTSYLESDIGLNAIAQWADSKVAAGMHQGLGTGSLYTNNVPSPLISSSAGLGVDLRKTWDLRPLEIA
jgi:L-alanine-DL-glutamate epimerase-like enolase superfamily enzyme